MDRQSLLAFLLIGVIIVFYPWYMNLVSPIDVSNPDEYIAEQNVEADILEPPKQQEPRFVEKNNLSPLQTVNIKNNLYELTISNKNGGSLLSHSLYNYNDHNGKLVNLIDELNTDNLILGFVSIDGDKVLSLIHI